MFKKAYFNKSKNNINYNSFLKKIRQYVSHFNDLSDEDKYYCCIIMYEENFQMLYHYEIDFYNTLFDFMKDNKFILSKEYIYDLKISNYNKYRICIEFNHMFNYNDIVYFMGERNSYDHITIENRYLEKNIKFGDDFFNICIERDYFPKYDHDMKWNIEHLKNYCLYHPKNYKMINTIINYGVIPNVECLKSICSAKGNINSIKIILNYVKPDLECVTTIAETYKDHVYNVLINNLDIDSKEMIITDMVTNNMYTLNVIKSQYLNNQKINLYEACLINNLMLIKREVKNNKPDAQCIFLLVSNNRQCLRSLNVLIDNGATVTKKVVEYYYPKNTIISAIYNKYISENPKELNDNTNKESDNDNSNEESDNDNSNEESDNDNSNEESSDDSNKESVNKESSNEESEEELEDDIELLELDKCDYKKLDLEEKILLDSSIKKLLYGNTKKNISLTFIELRCKFIEYFINNKLQDKTNKKYFKIDKILKKYKDSYINLYDIDDFLYTYILNK